MIDAMRIATQELVRFLEAVMPNLSDDWWQRNVVDRLSFQQQRTVTERGHNSLRQLDFAALLRVLDQNWYELSSKLSLPREGRTWVKELQTVRNKWAHLSSESMPASEVYRDADTLSRLLGMVGAERVSLEVIDAVKASALAVLASSGGSSAQKSGSPSEQAEGSSASVPVGPASTFKVGEVVTLRSDPAIHMPVLEVLTGGPECRYRVFQNGIKATYYESQLQAIAAPSEERESVSVEDLHALLTGLHILSPSTATLFSLRSGRVQFVPYQYRPVLKLIHADRPRLLIADEVGVGKTIEAGLIIKELRARMDIGSVLVICPKALVAERKWQSEMKRFDEHFTHLDGPLLRHCLKETELEGEWPEQYAKSILPFSLFDSDLVFGRVGRKKERGLLQLDPPPQFDLVIVDEAHHLRNSETFLHQGVRYFCDHAKAVVLLTATPVQLGSEDLFTLLNVLRPDLVIDHASFAQMAEPNRYVNEAVEHCRAAKPGWEQQARTSLSGVARTEWGRLFVRESPAFQAAYDKLQEPGVGDADRVALTRAIEELYTFSSLINRTRRRDIGEFTTRKPETVSVEFTPEQCRLHDGLLQLIALIFARCHGQQNVKFMMTTIRRQAASCLYGLAPMLADILAGKLDRLEAMEASDDEANVDLDFIGKVRQDIENLLEQARSLDSHDEKVERFVQILIAKRRLPNNKALVFSTFRHTLRYLAVHTDRAGLRYGLVHGDVPDEERSELRRRFALPKDDADALDVLLSSEVGCEGLDFQFCDLLINYDLPWNPMRIEQRIGRIDRYGQQSEAVAIINFITPGTVDADIYERCLWRIGVFQHAVGGSEEILGHITQELHDIADSFALTAEERARRLQQLADNGIRRIREEQELEAKQAELFGLNVPSQTWREEIEAAETYWLSPEALQRCVVFYLSARLGADGEHLLSEKPLKTLRLSQEARSKLLEDYRRLPRSIDPTAREWEKWLKGGQPFLSVTFDQYTAADNRNAVHLTIVHPLVRQAAACLDLSKPKYCAVIASGVSVAPGLYNFALYRWAKHGIKPDESLIAIADQPEVEAVLFDLLRSARKADSDSLPDSDICDALDARHHAKWSEAQANHMAQNRELAEHRIQSLTASHRARCNAIEDQIARATNEKIRLMKEGELARANTDFNRRIDDLNAAANSSDIRSMPIVFGTVTVTGEQAS